ncbi:MAG: hypothetical protein K9J06_14915 [Flavobacteriales bacterium]|nr:hypothetical protein [Flavobacteriales bacterium]
MMRFKVQGSKFKVAALGVLLLYSVSASAQSIRSAIDSTQLLIGDQFHLDLWADIPAGSMVAWPQFKDTLIKTIEVVEATVPDTVRKENGDYTVHQRLVLTSFDTGFMVIPPVAFVFDRDTANPLLTDPELILVTEIPVDLEQDIMDIKGPMDVPINWRKYLLYGLIALVVIGLLVGGFLYWQKHRKQRDAPAARPVPTRPAHEIALEKLEALRLKKLWQSDRAKEYYIELSDIVREYIEFRFGIMALEQTTDETVRSLQITGVDTELLKTLSGMMQLADLAKFAKYRPMSDENEKSMDVARGFVENTRAIEGKPDSGNKSDSN